MLKKLRNKKTAKRIWFILLILIIPAFIFWGFGSFLRSKEENMYVGSIFDKRVTSLEYKDSLDAVKNQAIIQFGENLSKIQKYLDLESQAWDRLLLLAEAKKRKITVSDQEVIELIQSHPIFKQKEKFDNQLYLEYLGYYFHTQPRIFEEQTRQKLIVTKLYKEVTDSINLSEEEIKENYRKLNEQVSLYYIASSPSDFAKDIAPQEGQIKDYFAKDSLQFKQPLSFNLEYISLPQDKKDIKDRIRALALRLNRKEDFSKAAKDFDLQVKETGLFSQNDPIPGMGWSPQILSLVSKLKTGEYTQPIVTDKDYLIIRLKEKKEPYVPGFETIKDKVKEVFIKERSREIAQKKIEACLKELKAIATVNPKAINFPKLAKRYGLKSDSTGLFKYGSYIEGIGASDNFYTEARALNGNDFSEIINMPSGFYIIRLKISIPVDDKKFNEEKGEFTARLLAQKKEEYFSKFLQGLKRKAQLF